MQIILINLISEDAEQFDRDLADRTVFEKVNNY